MKDVEFPKHLVELINVVCFTLMNKTLLDVACETLTLKTIPKILCSDTMFVTTREHPLVVTGVLDLEEV